MKTGASANYFGSFEWEGKQVEFTVKVYGEAYYYPEKRVSGNPTMIESFEESGVDVKDFAVDELTIDGQEAELTKELEDEIGYGHCITQFSELNGDWVDDNEVEYWCEIEPFKE